MAIHVDMKDLRYCVFIAFMICPKYDLYDLHNHIKIHFDNTIALKEIETIIKVMKKENTLVCQDAIYSITEEGDYVIADHKQYYDKYVSIITRFFQKYTNAKAKGSKKYSLRETRPEQSALRNHCIANKPHICVICFKSLPLCLLETAHLKPRTLLNEIEMADKHIVEFMCRFCHPLYDEGSLGIRDGILCMSSHLIQCNYDLACKDGTVIPTYNILNKPYFDYHYMNIYKSLI